MILISTLKDIANVAGVSVMTVSNVVNGNHSKVSKETIDKINHLVQEMKYTPNAHARVLSTKKSSLIAFCIPSNTQKNLLEDPYNSYIAGAISRQAEAKGYSLLLNSETDVQKLIQNLKSWNLAGAIFLGISEKDLKEIHNSISIPFVCLDSYFDSDQIISIGTNDYQGGWLAGNYLTNLGHKNIAYASGKNILDKNSKKLNPLLYYRFKGFKDALKEKNLSVKEEQVLSGEVSYNEGIEMGHRLARMKDVSAVFCTADILAIGIMEGLRLNGINVPSQISVLGFDDLNVSQYVHPKLSTVHQQNSLKGEKAIDSLLELISNPKATISSIKYDVKIVERQTTIAH